MNLYEIVFKHYAPKDSESGIIGYILKGSDGDVMRFLSNYPKINGRTIYMSIDESDDEETYGRVLSCRGTMYDEEWEVSDLYYGATTYGWKLVKENISDEEVKVLVGLGILK